WKSSRSFARPSLRSVRQDRIGRRAARSRSAPERCAGRSRIDPRDEPASRRLFDLDAVDATDRAIGLVARLEGPAARFELAEDRLRKALVEREEPRLVAVETRLDDGLGERHVELDAPE